MSGSLSIQLSVLFLVIVGLIILCINLFKRRQAVGEAIQLPKVTSKHAEPYAEINEMLFIAIRHDLHSVKNALNSFQRILEFGGIPESDASLYTEHLKSVILDNTFLLENLFFWGSAQGGTVKPVMTRFDIGLSIGGVIESLQKKIEAKKITLFNQIGDNTLVTADVVMVEVVLKNILYNAIKYTSLGGNITLTSEERGGKVGISIRDSGVGMTEERVRNFNDSNYLKFVKSQRGTEGEDGTGVGLILCRYFLKLVDARISVVSEPGKGSTFSILFT